MTTTPTGLGRHSTGVWLNTGRFFRLLADETRLIILQMLALSDLRAGEIGAALNLPSNAVSYHLKQFRSLELLHDRRSSSDARDVYYHLDVERLQTFYALAGNALYPGLIAMTHLSSEQARAEHGSAMPTEHAGAAPEVPQRPLRVLFLCTHNSARSQIAEAILRRMGEEQVEAYSAGSDPTMVDPDTLVVLRELGIDASHQASKSLATFAGQQFDYIITVCDRVRDACPVFPGDPAQIHWSIPDPVVIEDPESRLAAFRDVARDLTTRTRYLLLLPHPGTGQRLQPRQ